MFVNKKKSFELNLIKKTHNNFLNKSLIKPRANSTKKRGFTLING